jgi:hypothetical protein
MQITPISIGQTLRPTTPTIQQIGRVEKRMAPEAAGKSGRVTSSSKNSASSRTSRSRKKMNWTLLGEAVDVFV